MMSFNPKMRIEWNQDLSCHNHFPSAFSTLSFSTKNIRLQLHGDAKLTIARLHPHHARLALEGLVFEIDEKPDRLSDRICALGLKENSRCADIARDADPIVQLHRQSELKAFSLPSLLKTPAPPTVRRTMPVIPGENN